MLVGSILLDGGKWVNIMSYIVKIMSKDVKKEDFVCFLVEVVEVMKFHVNILVCFMLKNHVF